MPTDTPTQETDADARDSDQQPTQDTEQADAGESHQEDDEQQDDTPPIVTPRRRRAAEDKSLTVDPEADRVAGAEGLAVVESEADDDGDEEDREHMVDVIDHACECEDFHYRVQPILENYEGREETKPACKHLHRARWVMGIVAIPAMVVLHCDVDDNLGCKVDRDISAKPISVEP